MSLREQLQKAVASCAPYEMQHATFPESDATGHATAMQLMAANPHKQRVFDATGYATAMQPESEAHATPSGSNDKLRVALTRTCNLQQTAEELTRQLIEAAMRGCDAYGDGEHAREQMRRDVLETPEHLRQDLLDHFRKNYPP